MEARKSRNGDEKINTSTLAVFTVVEGTSVIIGHNCNKVTSVIRFGHKCNKVTSVIRVGHKCNKVTSVIRFGHKCNNGSRRHKRD